MMLMHDNAEFSGSEIQTIQMQCTTSLTLLCPLSMNDVLTNYEIHDVSMGHISDEISCYLNDELLGSKAIMIQICIEFK